LAVPRQWLLQVAEQGRAKAEQALAERFQLGIFKVQSVA
jgi:hypothetical protein